MKKAAFLATILQFCILLTLAAQTTPPPAECTLCVGAVADLAAPPAAGTPVAVPLLVELPIDEFATKGAALSAMSPEQRRKTTVIVRYGIDGNNDPLLQVEERTKSIVEWARIRGPLEALGVVVDTNDATVASYAVKRLAVTAQGLDVASRIVLGRTASLQPYFEGGAQSYFDAVLVDAANVTTTAAWLAEHDPSKKIYAVVTPSAPNVFYDLALALSQGATRAYTTGQTQPEQLASFNRAFAGDWAFDATSRAAALDAKGAASTMPLLTFVRGEDLRTLIIARGDAASAAIVAVAADQYTRPRRIDAAGEREITDSGRRDNRLLIGMPAVTQPFLVSVEPSAKPDVTREAMEVATARGITVEEIIRNHQAYDAYQESVQPRYVARNETKLRFAMEGGEAIEATIAGDYFSSPAGESDWVWQDFFINGVRWRYGRVPELPLVQPEKVTQLPLDIHLTNEYRYELVRETEMLGYRTYEVRFEPPRNAPAALPLYRGTVWIDTRTWARIRISMVQLNLSGEVLSNEERVDFGPFARDTKQPLTPAQMATRDPRETLWLPADVSAQQVISAAGRANVVQRATTFTNFRIEPSEYETMLATAQRSDARMVRETERGLRYLEKKGDGTRVVKEDFDTSRLFLLGGIYHDEGLEFPVVPLGGVNYFDFNLAKKGIQTNVFFAGVILLANATHPNVANTRTNVGLDLFALAISGENQALRDGVEVPSEAVTVRPASLTLRAGHPFAQFGKVDIGLGLSRFAYGRGDDTSPDFRIPTSTFLISPSIAAQYSRWGYTVQANYDYSRRTKWEPWGNPGDYDPSQKSFARFGGSVAKSFFLPRFQRISVDATYLDGTRLDRFSKYELGNFGGSARVHGIQSGSVRAEQMLLGHASYGFVFSDQFRLEAFYDHAVVTDAAAGYKNEPFQGIGLAGQTIGPFGTLLRLDLGKTVGRNKQEGFVANVVFLKLF
ncbi:MAG TPA: hypothetical protein VF618_14650 [Thermoanaerobaculia bacterium]